VSRRQVVFLFFQVGFPWLWLASSF
jgi:hypothetical protein